MDADELRKHKKHVAFDLDLTLIKEADFPEFGEIIEENVAFLRELHEEGIPIAIFTARIYDDEEMTKLTEEFLKDNNIPYNELTCEKKPYFVLYVDDRGCHIPANEPFTDEKKKEIKDRLKEYIAGNLNVEVFTLKSYDEKLEKEIEDKLKKELSNEDVIRIMDTIKKKNLNISVLKLAFPEISQKSDLLDKMKNGEKNVV